MMDEQIVKALECCKEDIPDCKNCPYADGDESSCDNHVSAVLLDILDLIKRQQAEIERLHEVINAFEEQSHKELMDYMQLSEKYENARAEAVREFAEKLKEKATSTFYEERKYVDTEDIDELVREMT